MKLDINIRLATKMIRNEGALFILLNMLIVFSILFPKEIIKYPSFIDWNTIISLIGLLLITTGLIKSGYFFILTKKILKGIKTERELAAFLFLASISFSTFLTNDVALFIIVPATIAMKNIIEKEINKLVIFEAISVNVGSALTPIGNPQNLFLWHQWNISFLEFVFKMLPFVSVLLIILLVFGWLVFPKKEIKILNVKETVTDRNLFILSFALLIIYVICIEIGLAGLAILPIIIIYLCFYRKVLLNVDWLLVLLFSIMFIDFHIISNLPSISVIINTIDLHPSSNVFLFSAFTSQIFSNVPASMFVSNFTHDWMAITYGVNVGGNGLVIASLANIIALRMANSKKIWIDFHKYSIFYFIICLVITYIIFYAL